MSSAFLPAETNAPKVETFLTGSFPSLSKLNPFMDEHQARAPAAQVRPLHLRKSSSTQLPRSHAFVTIRDGHQNISKMDSHAPQPTSIPRRPTYPDLSPSQHRSTRIEALSASLNMEQSSTTGTTSGYSHTYLSTDGRSATSDTRHQTMLSNETHYFPETSSAIMGDFVPINSPNMAGLQPNMGSTDSCLQGTFRPFQAPKVNPYEFEPASPYDDPMDQTTFTDIISEGQETPSAITPRSRHVKNSRSEDNAMRMTQAHNDTTSTPIMPRGQFLFRSESSPSVSQLPFSPQGKPTPSSNTLQYNTEAFETTSPTKRSHEDSEKSTPRGDQNIGARLGSKSPLRRPPSYNQDRTARSPIRHGPKGSLSRDHPIGRNTIRSPAKTMDHLSELDEYQYGLPNQSSNTSPCSSPKKRSRSPMKKMFGENGWLGKSPNEMPDLGLRSRKKIGMMEKLKNKFEEIAEKADLSPMGRTGMNSDKKQQSVLTISLGPPDQARVYMEIELMLVHTANSFLMVQFRQGRMDIDSIKKTVEAWKNKGRPVVIEFMYDQATQRDLVVANQQNFRFHGTNAGSDIRVSSMLYNWKQVANLMLIRTFCNADTVILKLLFDIEQILELLGAVEPMMIRLQQIRATASEMMRIARQSKDSKASSTASFRGRAPPRNSASSASTLYSLEGSYGGMKLVPDGYKE